MCARGKRVADGAFGSKLATKKSAQAIRLRIDEFGPLELDDLPASVGVAKRHQVGAAEHRHKIDGGQRAVRQANTETCTIIEATFRARWKFIEDHA